MNVGALRFKGVKHAFVHGSSMPGLPAGAAHVLAKLLHLLRWSRARLKA